MQMTVATAVPAAVRAAASPAASWPSPEWKTWTPTHDRHMARTPIPVMQAAPIAPNAAAVAQADFSFAGNYTAHGSLDVFEGARIGRFESVDAAIAAAQALKGAKGIVGIFRTPHAIDVRQLLIADSYVRGPGDDFRDARPAPRVRPTQLVQLRAESRSTDSWTGGYPRTLSALRFVDADLIGFVGADHQVVRPAR